MATTAKTKTEEVKETKVIDEEAYWNERVLYKIPFDRNDNSDAKILVNGHMFLVQRGVEVTLPRNAIEVWEQSQAQDLATWRATQDAERKFEEEVKSRGL